MKREPSILAGLVIAYRERFGRHVPATALRLLDAGDLAAALQDSIASGVALPETGWDLRSDFHCCVLRFENPERAAPNRGPDGRWRK